MRVGIFKIKGPKTKPQYTVIPIIRTSRKGPSLQPLGPGPVNGPMGSDSWWSGDDPINFEHLSAKDRGRIQNAGFRTLGCVMSINRFQA